jgi:hypothetical protein
MRNVQNWQLATALVVLAACTQAPPTFTVDRGSAKKDTSTDDTDPSGGDPGGDGTPPPATPPGAPPPDGDAGVDPDSVDAAIYATPVQCSSGTHWTQGDTGSDRMQPGSSCGTCHVLGGSASKKTWDISGTVYKTAHEPNDCDGTSATGVTVVITDVNGAQTSLPVNAAGNFYHADLFGFGKIPTPYKAKVVAGGKERVMVTPQTDGNCNSCHTESGTKSAPGRIMMP